MKQQGVNTIKGDRDLVRSCEKAILSTLLYRSVFDSALTFHQLATYLISDEEVDLNLFKDRLESLISRKKIVKKKNNTFHLPGKKALNWHNRSKNSKKLLKHYSPLFKILRKLKWVKMVGVTGSVAAHNAGKNDDLDLFIVTERNRLWITRFFVVLILKVLNSYPHHDDTSGKVCPNIFVDEDSLSWDTNKRNVYVAHEILMLHPIINRDNTYFKFLKKNLWVLNHFANFPLNVKKVSHSSKKYNSIFVDLLEKGLMFVQLLYMHGKKTTEVTTSKLIHFNKSDHTGRVLKTFDKFLLGR